LLRGGAYKPRTSPYSFSGWGRRPGVPRRGEAETGLPVVTEVMSPGDVEQVAAVARHAPGGDAQRPELRPPGGVGSAGKPILLKRGLSNTIEEWLLSAEHVVSHGNPDVVLCERGIRTFETATRNTLD